MKDKIYIGIIVVLALGIMGILSIKNYIPLGSSDYSRVATTSNFSVGPQEVITLFSKNNACSSRIISTYATGIMLSFHSNQPPTGARGIIQAASTTVSYDSSDYGCGVITAYGIASTTITVWESNN